VFISNTGLHFKILAFEALGGQLSYRKRVLSGSSVRQLSEIYELCKKHSFSQVFISNTVLRFKFWAIEALGGRLSFIENGFHLGPVIGNI
jgi:hypothetical protein